MEAQRSGSSLQQHLAIGLPAPEQDADNDNDDTTLFRRPSEWVSQLSSLVGQRTPEKWDDLELPFKRSVAAPAARPQPPAARPRPPRPVPIERPAPRDSLEPVQAVEGGLQRSMRPAGERRRRLLALSLPLFGALLGLLAWNTPRAQWPLWRLPTNSTTPVAATRGLPMPPQAAPAPAAPPEPQLLAAVVATPPEAVATEIPEVVKPAVRPGKPSPREVRHARRAAQKDGRIRFTRPVMQLPAAAADDDDAQPSDDALAGTLQINSRPWARVLVDGKFVGHTPQRGLPLSAGWHRVRLINEQLGMSKSLDIEIRAGQTSRYVEMLDDDATKR